MDRQMKEKPGGEIQNPQVKAGSDCRNLEYVKGYALSGFSPGYRIKTISLPVTGFLVMTIKRAQSY